MANDAMIQVRIDSTTKNKAAKLFKRFGLSTSDGVRMLINRAIQEKDIPHIPNALTRKTIEDARANRNMKTVTLDDLQKIWNEA